MTALRTFNKARILAFVSSFSEADKTTGVLAQALAIQVGPSTIGRENS